MRIFKLLLLIGVLSCPLMAQKSDTPELNSVVYVFETADGGRIVGTVVGQDNLCVRVKSEGFGIAVIPRSTINSIEKLRTTDRADWFGNPASNRYIIGPSAIPLRKGESYWQNLYIFFNGYNYGFTNHFSLKVGTEFLSSAFSGNAPSFISLSPRLFYQLRPNIYAGGYSLYSIFPGRRNYHSEHYLTLGGAITFGNSNSNITIGIGWNTARRMVYIGSGNYRKENFFSQAPNVSLSAMARISKRFGIVTENWFYAIPSYHNGISYGLISELYYSIGVRGYGRRFTFDFGAMGSSSWYFISSRVYAVPYIGFSYNFQNKRASPKVI